MLAPSLVDNFDELEPTLVAQLLRAAVEQASSAG